MPRKMDVGLDLYMSDMQDAVNGTVLAVDGLNPAVKRILKNSTRGAYLLARCLLYAEAAQTLRSLEDALPGILEDGDTWHLGMLTKITAARTRLEKTAA